MKKSYACFSMFMCSACLFLNFYMDVCMDVCIYIPLPIASSISEVEVPISSTVGRDEEAYYQYNDFPEEGITLKLTATEGSLVMYATDKTSNPSEALYDVRAETSSYTDVYINYNTLYGQCLSSTNKRQASTHPDISEITLYVTISGQADTNNSFTLITTFDDTSTTPGLICM